LLRCGCNKYITKRCTDKQFTSNVESLVSVAAEVLSYAVAIPADSAAAAVVADAWLPIAAGCREA